MANLTLQFAIILESLAVEPLDPSTGERRHGPLFHRWLPEGERDAIELRRDEEIELRVWMEPSGYVENGRIRFDYERKEIDPAFIPQANVLEGGPLLGELRVLALTDETLNAILDQRVDDPDYVVFGRKVAQLIHVHVSRLIDILRTKYGQYWISPLREWDSTEQTLGSYFSHVVQTTWSVDDGATWNPFIPETPVWSGVQRCDEQAYRQLLTEEDWRELQVQISEGYVPRIAERQLLTLHRLVERENLQESVLQAATTLELALTDFVHRKTRMNKALIEQTRPFLSLPVATQFALAATLSENISTTDVELVHKLLELRHKVLHEGWTPPSTVRAELEQVLTVIGSLLPGARCKFPSYYTQEPPPVELEESAPELTPEA